MSTAKKTAKRNSKPKTTKPVTMPSTAAMALEQGYGSHKEGSRKGKVHQLSGRGRLGPWAQTEIERGYAAKLVRRLEAAAEQQQRGGQEQLRCVSRHRAGWSFRK